MELPCVSHCLLVGDGQTNLGLLMTLDTIMDTEQGLPTIQLTLAAQKWFKAARFDVKTVTDVIKNIEAGVKHVIQVGQGAINKHSYVGIFPFQAGIDRTNQKAEKACQFIVDWDIKPISFSFIAGEIGLTGKLNRRLLTEKYAKHILKMFGQQGVEAPQVSSKIVEHHPPAYHQLSQIVEEENSLDKEEGKGYRARKNITIVQVEEKVLSSDPCESDRFMSEPVIRVTESEELAVSHENVKSVRFQSNVVQIQSYVDDEEITEGEEKRTRN